jgi:bifunctional non-homologous end joining protein LigD
MLAQRANAPFDSEDFTFEVKWDGIRCLAFVERHGVRLQSRELLDITVQFPELACLAALPTGTILDGELVSLRDGRPCLLEIQRRVQLQNLHRVRYASQTEPVVYLVFDLLYTKETSLMAAPLTVRRAQLNSLISQTSLPPITMPESIPCHGRVLFEHVVTLGLEGIMAKRKDSPYSPGKRSRAWLKIKPW